MRRLVACVALAVALSTAASVQAQTPDRALSDIRDMALYARYREALQAVRGYLERTDLTATQRNMGLELLATVQIAMRDQNSARQTLQQLYARDPGHRLSDADASPPVLSAFGRARSSPPPTIPVELTHEPPHLTARRPPQIEVTIGAGVDAVNEVRLLYRQGEERGYSTVVMNLDATSVATARLPVLDRTQEYTVQYYIEALAPSGAMLATQGTAEEPLRFTMPEASTELASGRGDREGSSTTSGGGVDELWWLWTLIAVGVAAGAAVGTYFIVQEVTGPDDGSLDTFQLPLLRF